MVRLVKKNQKIDLQFEPVLKEAGSFTEEQVDEILHELASILIYHWEKTRGSTNSDRPSEQNPS